MNHNMRNCTLRRAPSEDSDQISCHTVLVEILLSALINLGFLAIQREVSEDFDQSVHVT